MVFFFIFRVSCWKPKMLFHHFDHFKLILLLFEKTYQDPSRLVTDSGLLQRWRSSLGFGIRPVHQKVSLQSKLWLCNPWFQLVLLSKFSQKLGRGKLGFVFTLTHICRLGWGHDNKCRSQTFLTFAIPYYHTLNPILLQAAKSLSHLKQPLAFHVKSPGLGFSVRKRPAKPGGCGVVSPSVAAGDPVTEGLLQAILRSRRKRKKPWGNSPHQQTARPPLENTPNSRFSILHTTLIFVARRRYRQKDHKSNTQWVGIFHLFFSKFDPCKLELPLLPQPVTSQVSGFCTEPLPAWCTLQRKTL